MPKLEFRSNAKPSQYAYPPPLEDKKEKTKEKVLTAVLSITAKQKKKEAEKKKDEEKMDVVGQNKVKDIIYRISFRRKKDEEKMDVVILKNGTQGKDHNSKGGGGTEEGGIEEKTRS